MKKDDLLELLTEEKIIREAIKAGMGQTISKQLWMEIAENNNKRLNEWIFKQVVAEMVDSNDSENAYEITFKRTIGRKECREFIATHVCHKGIMIYPVEKLTETQSKNYLKTSFRPDEVDLKTKETLETIYKFIKDKINVIKPVVKKTKKDITIIYLQKITRNEGVPVLVTTLEISAN